MGSISTTTARQCMSPRRSSEPATPSVASVTETKHRTIMNKKQYNSIWAGSLALLLLAGSCSKSDETAAPEPSDGRIVVRAPCVGQRAGASFDRFGLYISESGRGFRGARRRTPPCERGVHSLGRHLCLDTRHCVSRSKEVAVRPLRLRSLP